jgi:hypothetical protein
MGKPIMDSARALFLTFLAPEKSKRNSTSHEDCPTAEKLCRSSAFRKVGTRSAAELRSSTPERDKIYTGAKNSNNS